MLARLRSRLPSHTTVVAYLALFAALSTGGAYAAHETIFSNDIVDGEVKNPDLGTDSVSTAKIQTQGVANSDLAPNSVTATRLATDSVETSEIKTGNVFNADIAGSTITSSRIAPDTLTGADVDESALDTVPRATRVGDVPGLEVTAREFSFHVLAPTSGDVLLNLGGLKLTAFCLSDTLPNLVLNAETTQPNADIAAYTVNVDSAGALLNEVFDRDFQQGELKSLLAGDPTGQIGHIVYTTAAGSVVTVQYRSESFNDECRIHGHAFQS